MMKKFLIISLCIPPGYLSAQQINNPVTVTANIKGIAAGQQLYYGPVNGTKKDSVTTVAGGFSFRIGIPEGAGDLYKLGIGKKAAGDSTIKIFLEKGDVQITGEGSSFKEVKLSGNQFFRDYHEADSSGQTTLNKRLEVLKEESPDGKLSKDEIFKAGGAYEAGILNWIKAHPSSTYAAVYLSQRYGIIPIQNLKAYFNALFPAAKNNIPSRILERQIRRYKNFQIGDMAPDFTLPDASGKLVSLKDFRGKYVLLDFWTSLIMSSRSQHSRMGNSYMQYEGQKNFTIIGISLDKAVDKDKWLKAIADDELVWTQLSALKGFDSEVADLYGLNSLKSFLIDPQGKIIAINLEGEGMTKKLVEVLKVD